MSDCLKRSSWVFFFSLHHTRVRQQSQKSNHPGVSRSSWPLSPLMSLQPCGNLLPLNLAKLMLILALPHAAYCDRSGCGEVFFRFPTALGG